VLKSYVGFLQVLASEYPLQCLIVSCDVYAVQPTAVMFSCMDSRVIMTRMLQTDVGDVFLVRNAGNLVPNNDSLGFDAITTEPGALELGCVINNIRHVLVCGHSDCKVNTPRSFSS